jgi:hypothetical protein
MDKLEQRLQQDAEEIRPTLAPEVSARLMARIKDTQQVARREGHGKSRMSWWLASSLTGVVAAAVVLAVVNRPVTLAPDHPSATPSIAQATPDEAAAIDSGLKLKLQSVVMTTPLEEELQNLESDFEKAREAVRRELRGSI